MKEEMNRPTGADTANHWMVRPRIQGTTAQDLFESAKEYFMWCEANPIYKDEMIKQTGKIDTVSYPRPFVLQALCLHCGVTVAYIADMVKNANAGEYHQVANWIVNVIYTQNLEYAMVGIFSSVITAKKLNLGTSDEEASRRPGIINIQIIKDGNVPELAENEFDNLPKEQ